MIGTGTGKVKKNSKKTGGNRKNKHCNETTCYLSKVSNGTWKNPANETTQSLLFLLHHEHPPLVIMVIVIIVVLILLGNGASVAVRFKKC